jgi:outer membrane protein OmpA-like peptidoglycan-associated protein
MADTKTAVKTNPDEERFPLKVVLFWAAAILSGWWLYNHFKAPETLTGHASAASHEAAHEAPHAAVTEAPDAWLAPVQSGLQAAGYSWLTLSLDDNGAVVVSGLAPGEKARTAAFDAAVSAIKTADEGAHGEASIINSITIDPASNAWTSDVLAKLNFDWLKLAASGSVATLSGTAPDAATRDTAFKAADTLIKSDADLAGRILLLVNGITVEGEDAGATEALLELTSSGKDTLSVDECAAAFSKTMQGRNIQFQTGSAVIGTQSARLLDALSGIAVLCVNSNGHLVEIGGHTDARGEAELNAKLSTDRALSVRDYLVGLGVEGNKVTAVGYGETQPLDAAETEDAYAVNRRTEFKVLAAD